MGYELFEKKKTRKRRAHAERPMMVYMDKCGRLTLNQGIFPILMEYEFKKTEVFIDYNEKKIGLKLLKEDEEGKSVKRIVLQPHRTRLTFVSFVAVRTALKLKHPFVRNATWDQKNHMIEFSFMEEK